MTIALWIVQIILAIGFAVAGGAKLTQRREQLAQRGLAYVEDLTPTQVRLIGAGEVLGAIGLILPVATGVAPVLTPIAAIGLAIIMVGAIATHVRRQERQAIPAPAILLVATLFVAAGRFVIG